MSIKNVKREKQILKLIKSDDYTYREIGDRFSISKQRVYKIAKVNLVKRREYRRKDKKRLAKILMKDIRKSISIDEVLKKHSITKNTLLNICGTEYGIIMKELRDKRNSKILKKYISGKTARNIVEDESKDLMRPNKINAINSIYEINTKQGFRRFPKIINRSGGGSYDSKRVINFIINKRDKHSWTFKKITEELNRLEYQSVTGVRFSTPNVMVKYHRHSK